MKLLRPILILFVLTKAVLGISQTPEIRVFDESYLHEIRISFVEQDFQEKLLLNHDNPDTNNRIPYIIAEIIIDGTHIDSVGIRYKGKSTFGKNRKKNPIKIDFNEFVKGQKYNGLKKLNLNNGFLDPSFMREAVSYKILREAGIVAPRTSYAKVFINDKYWGLYLVLEQLDRTFVKANFKQDKSDIVKIVASSNFEIQKNMDGYRKKFKIKSSKDSTAWAGLLNFIEVLNNTDKKSFEEEIEKVFNVEQYLRITAMNVILNNRDTDLTSGRNSVMYADKGSGYYNWLPWDYNSVFEAMKIPQAQECALYPDFSAFNMSKRRTMFYNGSSANRDVAFSWDFGDGKYSNVENPEHRFRKNGTYKVCLQINYEDECKETICKSFNTRESESECPSVNDPSFPHIRDFQVQRIVKTIPACCDEWSQNCEILYQYNASKTEMFHAQVDLVECKRNLISKIMEVPRFKEEYLGFVCKYISTVNVEELSQYIDAQANLIRLAIKQDKNRLHSVQLFELEVGNQLDSPKNLKNRIGLRKLEIQKQLEDLKACPN